MAPLDRALALAERDAPPRAVAEQLDLDVARPLEEALAEDRVVAERGLRLAPRRLERVVELAGPADDPHPAAAAARGRLDEQREAELGRIALLEHRARPPPGRSASPRACPRRRGAPPATARRRRGPAASTASAKSAFSARKP